jgi:reactive intermediate/imine deaminase
MSEVIFTDDAPKAIGAYHQAIRTGALVFLSGQIGLIPQTGEMVSSDFAEQTHQVFRNLKAVCKASGGDLYQLVKINVFLTDMNNFPMFNQIMLEYFSGNSYPARSTIACLGLPRNALVEVEGILVLES